MFSTKRFSVLLVIALLLASAFGVCASAEAAIDVTAAVSPADFLSPSDATLLVTVVNRTGYALNDMSVRMSQGDGTIIDGELAAGMTVSYIYPVVVTSQMLASGGVDVAFSFSANGVKASVSARATVNLVSTLPSARLTVSASARSVRAGDRVEITYLVENTGSVDMQSSIVADSLGEFATEPFSLAAGESARFQNTVTVSDECDSTARFTYFSRATGTAYTTHAQKLHISLAGDDVLIFVECEPSAVYGERAPVRVTVQNVGQHSYRFLSLSDAVIGNVTGLPGYLATGGSFSVNLRTPPLKDDAKYLFTLAMRDENGHAVEVTSNEVSVTVPPVSVKGDIAISASSVEDRQGMYKLRVRGAGVDIHDLKICERTLGELRTLEVLSANREIEILLNLPEIEADEYRLYVSYETDGGTVSAHAEPVNTASGSMSAANSVQVFLYSIVRMENLPTNVLILCLSLNAVIAVILLVRRRNSKRRRLMRRDELNITSKFAPVRKRDAGDKTV